MEKENGILNRALCLQISGIILLWALAAWFVDPVGEFMINDDWCYVKCIEAFRQHGRLIEVGWGAGGPALITHLLWGDLFTRVFGFSLTTLRISTIVIGAMGTLALFLLLRLSRVREGLAMLGALTLMFNPLFFSQSFTFMTDVTFASLTALSMLFLCLGVNRSNMRLIVVGLLFSLAATLTRQLGIVITLGFMGACLIDERVGSPGRKQLIILAAMIALVPWLLVEYLLLAWGGPTILDFQGMTRILNAPGEKGLLDYPFFLLKQFFYNGLCYSALLSLPVLIFRIPQIFETKAKKVFFKLWTVAFLVFETALLLGLVDPPTPFYRNIIIDFGIGPLLLKDTYILEIQRLSPLPKTVYFLFIYGAIICGFLLLSNTLDFFKGVYGNCSLKVEKSFATPWSFPASFSLLCAFTYLGIITLSGFHDRYLIPLCLFFIVWALSEGSFPERKPPKAVNIAAWCLLILMAAFSLTATRDFLETKRHVKKALVFAVNTLKVKPCDMDGGFEFNGYHCCQEGFSLKKGFSWWWVKAEGCLITLGPLPGYETIKTFPFVRYLGRNGAVHLLRPFLEGSAPATDEKTSITVDTEDRQK